MPRAASPAPQRGGSAAETSDDTSLGGVGSGTVSSASGGVDRHRSQPSRRFHTTPWFARLAAVTAPAAAAMLSYSNVIFYAGARELVLDDGEAVARNPTVAAVAAGHYGALLSTNFWGDDLHGTRAAGSRHNSFRPLTTLTFGWSSAVAGGGAGGRLAARMAAENVALHVLVTALFVVVVDRLANWAMSRPHSERTHHRDNGSPLVLLAACISGLLFAVHPVHVDAVASIVGRSELLCALFYLLAILTTVAGEDRRIRVAGDILSWGAPVMAVALAALATAAKETGLAVLPVCAVVVAVSYTPSGQGEPASQSFKRQTTKIAKILILIGGGIAVAGTRWGLFGNSEATSFGRRSNPATFAPTAVSRWMTQLYYGAQHIGLLLAAGTRWFPLVADRSGSSIPLVPVEGDVVRVLAVVAALLGLAALLSAAVDAASAAMSTKPAQFFFSDAAGGTSATDDARLNSDSSLRAACRYFVVAVAVVLCPMLLASGLALPVGFTVAERVMYLPSLGVCALAGPCLAGCMGCGAKRSRWIRFDALTALAVAVVLGLSIAGGARCLRRNPEWRTARSLSEATLRDAPGNANAALNWALAQQVAVERGAPGASLKQQLVLEIARSAEPDHSGVLNMLGVIAARQGQLDVALQRWEQGIEAEARLPPDQREDPNLLHDLRVNAKRCRAFMHAG